MLSEDILNRIGIVMNFLAGFFLAPELLGLDRIRRVADWAERSTRRLHAAAEENVDAATKFKTQFDHRPHNLDEALFAEIESEDYDETLGPDPGGPTGIGYMMNMWARARVPILPRFNRAFVRYLLAGAILFALDATLWYLLYEAATYIVPPVAATISASMVLVAAMLILLRQAMSTFKPRYLVPGALLWGWAICALFVLTSISILLSGLVARPVARLCRSVADRLSGDDRRRAIVTSVGILLFIAGNGLQFAATFL